MKFLLVSGRCSLSLQVQLQLSRASTAEDGKVVDGCTQRSVCRSLCPHLYVRRPLADFRCTQRQIHARTSCPPAAQAQHDQSITISARKQPWHRIMTTSGQSPVHQRNGDSRAQVVGAQLPQQCGVSLRATAVQREQLIQHHTGQ